MLLLQQEVLLLLSCCCMRVPILCLQTSGGCCLCMQR